MSQAPTQKFARPQAPAPPRGTPGSPEPTWPAPWVLLGILLATALVYGRSLRGELVYDDLLILQRNPLITSLANLPQIFSSSYWDFLDADSRSVVGYYRPLSMALLTLVWQVGGGATWAFHLVSLTVHGLASIAAALFVARLTRSAAIGGWAGLLFALHPLHVESVAWISAVGDPLSALFGLLALTSFLGWRERGSVGVPLAAGLLLLPALLAKDAALAVVAIALAVDLGRMRAPGEPSQGILRGLRPFARAYAPFAGALLVYYLMRVVVFGDLLAGFDRTTTDFGVGAGRLLWLRLELLAGFAWLALWPVELDVFRPFRPNTTWSDPSILVAALGSASILAACALALTRRLRPLAALALLFPAALVPVLLRVDAVGTFPLSDRFLYLGVVSLCGALAWLAWTHLPRPLASTGLVLVAALYGGRSFTRLDVWQNEEVLFQTAIAQHPDDPRSYWSLGRVRLQQYRAGDNAALEDAIRLFDEGMALIERDRRGDLNVYVTHDDALQMNLGQAWAYFYRAAKDPYRDYETPRALFERIVRNFPESERGHTGLGATLSRLGEHDAAAAALRTALQMNERSVEAHHNMGRLLHMLGDAGGAERHFRRALELRQGDLNDMMGLAQTLFVQGRIDEASDLAMRAYRAHPDSPGPLVLLGTLSNATERWSDAQRWFERALELAPDSGEVHFERAQSLALQQRTAEALPSYRRAFELRGGDFQVAYQYARALLLEGRSEEAVAPLVRAYYLRPAARIGELLHEELLSIRPDDLTLQWNLASAAAQRDEWDLASFWAERALALEPDHGPSRFLLGLARRHQERPEDAAREFGAAVQAMPDHYDSHLELAAALADLERFAEAIAMLERSLELLAVEPITEQQRTRERARVERLLDDLRTQER